MKALTSVLLSFLSLPSFCQVITVIRGGQSYFHYDISQLSTLINTNSPAHTLPGDTIILPGATIYTANITIIKPLTIIGAGIIPNGAPVTGITSLHSTASGLETPVFTIEAGGATSAFHGIGFQLPVRFLGFGLNSPDFSASFTRCVLNGGISLVGYMFGQAPPASNVHIRQSVIRNGITQSSDAAPSGFSVSNSYIMGGINISSVNSATDCIVSQCTILGTTNHGINYGLIYRNNIFARTSGSFNFPSSYAIFINNLFGTSTGTVPSFGANVTQSNNAPAPNSNIFTNVTAWNDYSINFNYSLATGSPAIGMGFGGYDVGVTGGPTGTRWKELAIPFNPHWQDIQPPDILGTTQGGMLNVTIQGAAQEN